jgi:PAS domain S-box-containing protein
MGTIYSALSDLHKAAATSHASGELYARACIALLKDDTYRAAWAGSIRHPRRLDVVESAGSTAPAPPSQLACNGNEPWMLAVEMRTPVVVRQGGDAVSDPVLLDAGLLCTAYIPVEGEARVRGVLAVGSRAREAFDPDELALLQELGRSLAAHEERLAAECALGVQRELVRAVLECATYGIYCATAEGEILLCNDAFLRLAGRPRSAVVGQSYQVITSHEFRETERDIVDRVISTGLPSEYDKEAVRGDGFRIPVRLSVAPVRDSAGRPVGSVAVARDTVAEREAATALRESEERYRATFRNNPDAIFVVDDLGHIVDANPAATALTGLSHSSLLAKAIGDLAPAADREELECAYRTVRIHGAVYRPLMRFTSARGRPIPTELHGTTLAPRLCQLLARDIGARLEAEAKLLALNDRLEEKVAARTREIEEARDNLARAGRVKDEFLANMSHELRTPLNSVLGFADALLEGVFGTLDDQQQQILETMRDSGRHLLDLINDILDLSKIDAGRLEIDMRSICVNEVCQASLRMVRPMAFAKKLITWMRTDPRMPVVVADERRLKQMLVNLLTNAVKFTPNCGKVGIEAWTDDNMVYFSVMDTGIGISPLDLRRIFEPFTQIDSSLARRHEGTGLGLALVRKLAELHGGHIDVDSEPGRGSRFSIVLPRLARPEREPQTESGEENRN